MKKFIYLVTYELDGHECKGYYETTIPDVEGIIAHLRNFLFIVVYDNDGQTAVHQKNIRAIKPAN